MIDDPAKLEDLVVRLGGLRPDDRRRWGTLEVGEMLCHLADAHRYVLSRESAFPNGAEIPNRRILKWVALYSPLPWSKNAQTGASIDPRREGTRPGDFEADRRRVIDTLRAIAAAPAAELAPDHALFGPMSARDWYRSTYRHIDHHLRQFGA